MATTTYDVTCRYGTQSYTVRHNGQSASSTMSREAERTEVSTAQALERRNLELHGEIKRLRAELDALKSESHDDDEWAVWRDRAALASAPKPECPT